MNALHAEEAAKYDRQWREDWYREKCHSLALWNDHRGLFPPVFSTAIDFGSGTGRLVKAWRAHGIDAKGVDISANAADADIAEHIVIANLWALHQTVLLPYSDVGVCADVMEHIPPEKVEDVIACIAEACAMCVFKIANFPSVGAGGQPLHLTLQPREWWERMLSQYGTVEYVPTKTHVEEYIFRVTFSPARAGTTSP